MNGKDFETIHVPFSFSLYYLLEQFAISKCCGWFVLCFSLFWPYFSILFLKMHDGTYKMMIIRWTFIWMWDLFMTCLRLIFKIHHDHVIFIEDLMFIYSKLCCMFQFLYLIIRISGIYCSDMLVLYVNIVLFAHDALYQSCSFTLRVKCFKFS